MKANVLRIAGLVFTVLMMNAVVAKAQSTFYETTKENGKMVSKTKYVKGYFGISVKESVAKYTYDENGDFLKKEVYVWNPTYKLNSKTGREYPDYSESNWTPQYQIQYTKNSINNYVFIELSYWNGEKKAYKAPAEMMVFQLNDSNLYNYLAFEKGGQYKEMVNNIINHDKALLAGLGK